MTKLTPYNGENVKFPFFEYKYFNLYLFSLINGIKKNLKKE